MNVEVGQILSERQTLRVVQLVDRARNTFPEDVRPEAADFKYALARHGEVALVRVELHDPEVELPLFTEIVVDASGRVVGEELLVRCEAATRREAVAA